MARKRAKDPPKPTDPAEADDGADSTPLKPRRRRTILMVSEFFYPDIGGIETHICALSTGLIELGYRVVMVTRHFGDRRGVRYLSNGMKVYHIPTIFYIKPCGMPGFFDTFLLARNIYIREQVDIVHVHQTTSRYASEFVHVAYIMGLKTVFTDHSLFSFTDLGPITTTDYLKHQAVVLNHTICVSTTHKENLVLRTQMDPTAASVIGNAIDPDIFLPSETSRNDGRIIIVVVSRLTLKKGTELLTDVIPIVCKRHENVDFIIGGDGPLYASIVECVDKLYLHKRVTLLGAVPNYKVNAVLKRGDIFLNTSKSESFCIAILEAVSSGLLCVSTNVGGVHEILPHDMVLLANYSPESIANRIDDAIEMLPSVDRQKLHSRVRQMYSWARVAGEVSRVYENVVREPRRPVIDVISLYWEIDTIFRGLLIAIIIFLYAEWWIAELLYPREEIDIAPDWSIHGSQMQEETSKTKES